MLLAAAVAAAITRSDVAGGTSVTVLGDTWTAFARIDTGASTMRGPVFYFADTGAGLSIANVRHLRGAVGEGATKTGSFGSASDTTPGSFTIPMTTGTTGAGSWVEPVGSPASLDGGALADAGETSAETAAAVALFPDTGGPACDRARLLNLLPGATGSTLRDSRAFVAALSDSYGRSVRADSFVAASFRAAAAAGGVDSFAAILAFNLQRDTFTAHVGSPALRAHLGESYVVADTARIETGTTYLYAVFKGGDTRIAAFRKAAYAASDSIGLLLGTVVLTDTSAGGGFAAGAPSFAAPVTATGRNAAQDSFLLRVASAVAPGPATLVIDPVATGDAVLLLADARTDGETRLAHGIADYAVLDGAGNPVFSFSDSVTIQVTTSETTAVSQYGLGLVYVDPADGRWKNLGTLDTPDSSIETTTSADGASVTLRAHVKTLPGCIVAVGVVAPPSAADRGGSCLLETVLGSGPSAFLSALRAARDAWLGTPFGRLLAHLYYTAVIFG